ncbi:MAG: putative spheroidene monooxygenase [Actinomycetia bacterium]|nr:putative spheroidene monooxygenase [Actinomycetes bacterium]
MRAAVPSPALVTVHVWRVPPASVPAALLRVARDKLTLRRTPGLRFGKLLGTGRDGSFSAREPDLRRWALVATWDDPEAPGRAPVLARWDRSAPERWRLDLRPLAAKGSWAGARPFGDPRPQRWDGPVAVLTRARLAPRRAAAFWAAIPPVTSDLAGCDGLLAAVGMGEAPLGWQGTLSVWRDVPALREFAYGSAAHRAVIERTARTGWYAEELFARFGVVRSSGTVNGTDPLPCA